MRVLSVLSATSLAVALTLTTPLYATTLTDALIQTYQTNPQLRSARSGLRATDEGVRQAKGALDPSVTANLSADRTYNTTFNTISPSNSISVTARYSLYAGGTGLKAIEQARLAVLAERQNLIATEQSVLLDAVEAYMNVRRDLRNLELAKNSVRVLIEEVRSSRERFEVGEVTRTDVSQAESRLAAAEGELSARQAGLSQSIDSYVATVGSKPSNLRTPPNAPSLPASASAAEAIAVARHPNILQQQLAVQIAENDVEIAKGNKLPTISGAITAANSRSEISSSSSNTVGISLDVDQTLYRGGILNSQQRAAVARLDQAKSDLQLRGALVRQNVQSSYSAWVASRASIQARQKQVRAAQIAFDGTSEEAKLGARTTLDALNAEQELRSARANLVTAIRDEYVSAYTVLAAMGLLTVDHLKLGIESYNPETNYKKVTTQKFLGAKRTNLIDKLNKRRGQ